MGAAAVDSATARPSSALGVVDISALAELGRQVGRLVFWLRAFAVFLALLVIAPVQAAVMTAPRIAVASGLLLAAGGITMLIQRGWLLPARAYAVSGAVAATAGLCELFIAAPKAAGSGSEWNGVFLALFLAIPAVIMNRRFARRSRPPAPSRLPGSRL